MTLSLAPGSEQITFGSCWATSPCVIGHPEVVNSPSRTNCRSGFVLRSNSSRCCNNSRGSGLNRIVIGALVGGALCDGSGVCAWHTLPSNNANTKNLRIASSLSCRSQHEKSDPYWVALKRQGREGFSQGRRCKACTLRVAKCTFESRELRKRVELMCDFQPLWLTSK